MAVRVQEGLQVSAADSAVWPASSTILVPSVCRLPKQVALQVVVDKTNDLFGAELFTESQLPESVQELAQRLLDYRDLVNETMMNSKK